MDYLAESKLTMSNTFHTDKVSQKQLVFLLYTAIHALEDLDKAKKAMFYGRDFNIRHDDRCNQDIQVHRLHDDPQHGIDLLHGIIGVATEAGELLEALVESLANLKPLDHVNLGEEVGDLQWYEAAILRVIGSDFFEVQCTNIKKLRARFPNNFTEYDANHRNLGVEREILEQKGVEQNKKPVVRIKDWGVMGGVLVGTAIDHPKGPGGETDVRTSSIVSRYDRDGVSYIETRNTLYQLEGASSL